MFSLAFPSLLLKHPKFMLTGLLEHCDVLINDVSCEILMQLTHNTVIPKMFVSKIIELSM